MLSILQKDEDIVYSVLNIVKTTVLKKLIYVLEEDNITEDSKYWYLTKLAAKCSAKRLVPDYISEKKMKELKEGNCFPVINKPVHNIREDIMNPI